MATAQAHSTKFVSTKAQSITNGNLRHTMVSTETITPDRAMALIEASKTFPNRRVNENWVNSLASLITKGDWKPEAGLFHFDMQGRAVNGQHRLWAIIKAGLPVTALCVYGVPEDSIPAIDTGENRKTVHVMDMLNIGAKYRDLFASGVRKVLIYDAEGTMASAKAKPSAHEIIGYTKEHLEDLTVSAQETQRSKDLIVPSVLVAVHHIIGRSNPSELRQKFFDALATGTGAPPESPVMVLRTRMVRAAMRRNDRPSYNEQAAMLIKTWNAHKEGKSLKIIVWKNTEGFPRIN